MNRIWLFTLFLFTPFLLTAAPAAQAASALCFKAPYPATPLAPSFTFNLPWDTAETASMTLWRQTCQDGSGETAVLGRITPVTGSPFICWASFIIVQNGQQIEPALTTSPGNTLCGDLLVPTTVVFNEWRDEIPFDDLGAFTLFYVDGYPQTTSIAVPAGGATPADRISGRLVVDGVPRVGYKVKLFQNGVKIGKAKTDANGSYVFHSLAPGAYEVRMPVTLH